MTDTKKWFRSAKGNESFAMDGFCLKGWGDDHGTIIIRHFIIFVCNSGKMSGREKEMEEREDR